MADDEPSEARRRARERIKQRRMNKQVGNQVPLVEDDAEQPLAAASAVAGTDSTSAASSIGVQDVQAMMMQMMAQMEVTAEKAATRAVQHALDRQDATVRVESSVDTGMAEKLAAAELQVAQLQADKQELEMIRHQKGEMDEQLERVSQQYNEFAREKQELELELERMREQLTTAHKSAEPVPELREENESLRTRSAVLETELQRSREQLETDVQRLREQLSAADAAASPVPHLREENESLRTRSAVLETELQRLREQLSAADAAASPVPQLREKNESLRLRTAVLETELEKEREAAAQRATLDAEARERHEALAAELNNMTQDLFETERDLEAEIEEKEELKKAVATLQKQLAQYAAVVSENQTLKTDQDLLTQELKRMQVEALQLKQKVTVAGQLTGTADEIARERDELRRSLAELKDDHTLQLAELQTELNAAQNSTEDARREAVALAQRGGAAGAEVAELQKRNAELLAHVSELEEDLAHSDADLEQAITQLEANGIALEDDFGGPEDYGGGR